jgi:hypothetical protein
MLQLPIGVHIWAILSIGLFSIVIPILLHLSIRLLILQMESILALLLAWQGYSVQPQSLYSRKISTSPTRRIL